jgi:SAM-dependent methyltransferase
VSKRERRESTRVLFDTAAEAYDQARPGYPDAVFDDLRGPGLGVGSSVLEVGCGTGQATRRLAEMAGSVTCVELGPDLARLAVRNLADHAHVRVLVGAFEDVDVGEAAFDVLFSGTAFHWIDPAIGFARAAAVLRPGGLLALACNAHVTGGSQDEILDAVSALQAEVCPELGGYGFATPAEMTERAMAGGDIGQVWNRVERRYEDPPDVSTLFEPATVRTYPWTVTYDRDGYVTMLSTQSPYLALDAERRARVLQGIGEIIDERLGGTITKPYLTVLAVAGRR